MKIPQEIIERVRGLLSPLYPKSDYSQAFSKGFDKAIDEVLKILEGE